MHPPKPSSPPPASGSKPKAALSPQTVFPAVGPIRRRCSGKALGIVLWLACALCSAKVSALDPDRWPGSGYPVLAYAKDKLDFYESPHENAAKRTREVVAGEIVDFGQSRIVVSQTGILRSLARFSVVCSGERGRTFIEKGRDFELLYADDLQLRIRLDEQNTCEFLFDRADLLLLYRITRPVVSRWWVMVHENRSFEKGWVEVVPENLTELPRLPANKNHDNRRGVTGDYSRVKIVSKRDERKVVGFFNAENAFDPIEERFKYRCFFFFQGFQDGDEFPIEIWLPQEEKRFEGRLKYGWRADKSHLLIEARSNPPGCGRVDTDFTGKPVVFTLVKEGSWESVSILKTDNVVPLEAPDGRKGIGVVMREKEPVLVLRTFSNWVLAEMKHPLAPRGWIKKEDLYLTDDLQSLLCKEFDEIPGVPENYRRLVCLAEAERDNREFAAALKLYEKALELDLKNAEGHPVPNYELYGDVADLKCQLGKEVESRLIKRDLLCMEEVRRGISPCYLEEREGQFARNEKVSEFCFARMCADPFPELYEPNPAGGREKRALMKSLETEILTACVPR